MEQKAETEYRIQLDSLMPLIQERLAAGQTVRLYSRRAELPVKIILADTIPLV